MSSKNSIQQTDAIIENLPSCFQQFFSQLRADKYSFETQNAYAYDMDLFSYFLVNRHIVGIKTSADITYEQLEKITPMDITSYKAFLSSYTRDGIQMSNSAAGINRKLSSLRSFYKFAQLNGFIKSNPMPAVSNLKLPENDIVYLDQTEMSKLIMETDTGSHLTKRQQAHHDRYKFRDIAIIMTLLLSGMRVSELTGLNITDIDNNNKSLSVHRKGNKNQFLYLTDECFSAITDYIAFERSKIATNDESALFLSNRGTRITDRSVQNLVKKYSEHPEVTNKHIHPHSLRKSFGHSLYGSSGDIYLTSDALGHASPTTTVKHYVAQDEEHRKSVPAYLPDSME